MTYMTLVETIRANAARHRANGDRWLASGKPDFAAGSYRKAERNEQRAASLQTALLTGDPLADKVIARAASVLAERVAREILSHDGIMVVGSGIGALMTDVMRERQKPDWSTEE